jgi:uncharacterized protein YcbK (DUF882 family)
MITLDEFLMGRDKQYPLTEDQQKNATDILCRVNYLLGWLRTSTRVTSGYRPGHFNRQANGAKNSNHLTCQAVDLADPKGLIGKQLSENKHILEECGLWMENPAKTKGWVHLDTKMRKNRIFNP